MKLLIWTTGNAFTPSMLYKENYLIKAAVDNGDEIVVFANEYTCIKGKTVKVSGVENVRGYRLRRFPYQTFGNNTLTTRIRKIKGLEDEIIKEKPDFIFINCSQIYNIQNLRKIKSAIPNVRMVLDFSTKYLNSARNWTSKNILHRIIYRHWIQKALPYVEKVFYISEESKDFARDMYGIPESLMEHNNLPGETIRPVIKKQNKEEIFERLGLKPWNTLIMYSGKIYGDKKVDRLVRAFSRNNNPDLRLLIIGEYTDEAQRDIIEPIIAEDSRIIFINFVSGEELTKYVCAADLYVQPGSISQTCQTAVCCGTPLAFTDIPTHREIYNSNGFFIDSEDDILQVLNRISEDRSLLDDMSALSYKMAAEELDYNIIYSKILKAARLNP